MAGPSPDPRTPVHVLTGFLGSGKTTVLRHLLADPAMAGTAVLINEAGAVGLDHLFVGRIEGEPVLLDSGCLCCTVRGDLVRALGTLLAGADPARIVIETSGLADPTPVLASVAAELTLRRRLRTGRVVATLDAVHAPQGLRRHDVLRKQAAVADALLLTKTDLADAAALLAALEALNPLAERHVCRFGAVTAAVFEGAAGRDWAALAAMRVAHAASTMHVRRTRPVDYAAFATWLSLLVHRHGSRLLRVKALLDVAGHDRPVALHAVQHLIHPPEHLAAWPGPRRSDLVAITDGLDPALLARSFATFVPE